MKKVKATFIISGVVLIILGFFLFNIQKTRERVVDQRSRSTILAKNKPITQKVGAFLWLYAYPKGSSQNREYIKSQIDLAKKTNLNYVVLPVVFKSDYLNNGKFNYSEFDYAIKDAEKDRLKPIVVFSSDNPNDEKNYNSNANKTLNKYRKLIKATIIRYHNRHVIWQMWNEPNGLFWFNQSQDGNDPRLVKRWTSLGSTMFRWVRKYDPKSVFLGGALAGNYSDAHIAIKLALKNGLYKDSDAIANHPYLSKSLPDNGAPENLFNVNSRKLLTSLSDNSNVKKKLMKIPLVTTEFGYSLQQTHSGIWSEGDQANYIARSVFILDMMHQPIISLYSLVDEGNGDGQWGLYRGTSPHYIAKQSGQLLTQLLSNLNGYRFNKRITEKSNRDFVLEYVKKGQKDRFVCWTMDSNHSLQIADQNVMVSQTPQIVYFH
ncbi:hypothetical protein IWT25_00453 [Secundilactobacillus pentosiphilus]|uniref:Glycoside hydrolase family 5 domain-containing protein n=1 Tax=Secundilactobacillus pentosiphilus TaxID=1714682 RepID=A0A1Z5ITS4_9LACO|nr:hypothetical protein [Secundilactobacillus pentosiphilus]GAX05150.1 hypothetical protein IWT25_00453 [Secundilactobacillus pentosiphilus]